jgi:hypothetical protein
MVALARGYGNGRGENLVLQGTWGVKKDEVLIGVIEGI